MRKALRSIGLFALLIGPFSLFFILSKGRHEFQTLPFLIDGNNGIPSTYTNLRFTSSNGDKLSLDSFKDKILIVTSMAEGCPSKCPIDAGMMKFSLYNEIQDTKGFNDVVMISECEGPDSLAAYMADRLEVHSNRWYFVSMPQDQSFFNVRLNKHNPYKMKDPDKKAVYAHQRSVLLIDKERRVRGFYDISRSIEFKRIMQELRLLKKQYSKEKEKRKVRS